MKFFLFSFPILRLKNFCGSIADSVQSKTNVVHIRYFAEAVAINSSFAILYTAFGDKGSKGGYPIFCRSGFTAVFRCFISPIFLLFSRKHHATTGDCEADEYDCEDQTCIDDTLVCNGNVNCRFRWDEDPEKCDVSDGHVMSTRQFSANPSVSTTKQKKNQKDQSEHMLIIFIVFGVMLTLMVIAFIVNCMRKIMRDHKIIRVSISL